MLSVSERTVLRVKPDAGSKSPSLETILTEPIVTTNKETALMFIKRVMGVHTVPKANEDVTSTIVERNSDIIDYIGQPPSKSLAKLPSDTRSEIEHAITNLRVVMKTDVDSTFENLLTKWPNKLQSQIVKAV